MVAVLWFRRDLRLRDHPSLLAAAAESDQVLACFVVDPVLEASTGARRVQFLGDSVRALRDELDGRLLVTRGRPEEVVPSLVRACGASSVHVSEDFAPFGRRRDDGVRAALGDVPLVATGSPYLVPPDAVTKDDGTPYRVFTPFLRRWRELGWPAPARSGPDSVRWLDPAGVTGGGIAAAEIPDPGIALEGAAGAEAASRQWAAFVAGGLAKKRLRSM